MDIPSFENLKFYKLCRSGKQGIVGVMKDKEKRKKYAFKISQFVNYLAEHEHMIMNRLNEIHDFCPHFCRSYGLFDTKVEPKPKKNANPFEIVSKYPISTKVVVEEFIDGEKLAKLIANPEIETDVLMNALKQTLLAVAIAQDKCDFVHYDLHSNNILMQPCDPNIVFLYLIDDDNAFAVPSHGYCARVIDFGFSYIDHSNNNKLRATLAHTADGYMSVKKDAFADPKVLLISFSQEMANERPEDDETVTFCNTVSNLFGDMNVHWDCGWDDNDSEGASYALMNKMQKKTSTTSKLFKKYGDHCLDIMLSMIDLPLKKGDTSSLQIAYDSFVKEFQKIEQEVNSSVYNLYILKGIVDAAKNVKILYSNPETQSEAITKFGRDVTACIHSVTKFCSPKKLHFERLLCALLSFEENAEGFLYKIVEKQMKEKEEHYRNVVLQSISQMVSMLVVNMHDSYEYSPDTTIIVMDAQNESRSIFRLDEEQCEVINDLPPYFKGFVLKEYFEAQEQGNVLSDEEDN